MTSTSAVQSTPEQKPWFASWFDSVHYHRLYAHRDRAEAEAFIDRLVAWLRAAAGARAVDLGCGAGRHAIRLASKGLDVTGLDLAAGSIAEARRHAGRDLRFFRHDMREPFGQASFDYVFSFFTSFGYFDDAADHLAVVRNMSRALAPWGGLVLDYLNTGYADAHMVLAEQTVIDGVTYRITRWADARAFFKRITVEVPGEAPLDFQEQVARFGLEDFRRLFAANGLRIDRVFGDYQLGAYDEAASPRLIMVARKSGSRSLLRAVAAHPAERLRGDAQV